jgi:hypothetical protein
VPGSRDVAAAAAERRRTAARQESELDRVGTGRHDGQGRDQGVSGSRPIVLLTVNEILAAREEPDWVLAVVTRALVTSREILMFDRAQALAEATPYVYRADMARGVDRFGDDTNLG